MILRLLSFFCRVPSSYRARSTTEKSPGAEYRIVNWAGLSKQLDKCGKCGNGPLNLTNTTEERRAGLAFICRVRCQLCDELNVIRTDEVHENLNTRGPKKSKLNEQAVLGTMHSGNGHAQLESLLAPMGVSSMHSKTYKEIERVVGKEIENVAHKSCEKWREEEKTLSQGDDLAISYDMGWQKRGKAKNSSTGQGTMVGVHSGKIIDYATRNLACRICKSAESSGKKAAVHDCRKNHTGSSKCMEPEAAAVMYGRAKENGVRYNVLIGDEDSTTICRIRQEAGKISQYATSEETKVLPKIKIQIIFSPIFFCFFLWFTDYEVSKHADFTHVKRNFGSDLYKAKAQVKGNAQTSALTDKVIAYLEKSFSYALYQNKNNPKGLKAALDAIVPHAFGNHSLCNSSWCGYLVNAQNYKHKELPNGEDLVGEGLKTCLLDIMKKYTNAEMIEKIAPMSSSQKNESVNGVIGTKSLKIRYYGGSESNDHRVAAGVAQVNEGIFRPTLLRNECFYSANREFNYYCNCFFVTAFSIDCNYLANVMEEMDIEVNEACSTYISRRKRKKTNDQQRKSSKEFKRQRRNFMLAKRIKAKQNERREGITYDTGIAMELTRIENETLADISAIKPEDIKRAEEIAGLTTVPQDSGVLKPTGDQLHRAKVVFYDTETTSRALDCEIVQLAAICGDDKFSTYIVPDKEISAGAAAIHGISLAYSEDGQRGLSKNGVNLNASTKAEAFTSFLQFLSSPDQQTIVLAGYNSYVFDNPRLIRQLQHVHLLDKFLERDIYLGDALPLVRKENWLPKSKSLGTVYQAVTGDTFNAHDALEDATALQHLMKHDKMKEPYRKMKEGAKSLSETVAEIKENEEVANRMATFRGNLKDVLSGYMIKKIAKNGIENEMLSKVEKELGSKGVVALLARVTNKPEVVTNVLLCLRKNPRD